MSKIEAPPGQSAEGRRSQLAQMLAGLPKSMTLRKPPALVQLSVRAPAFGLAAMMRYRRDACAIPDRAPVVPG